LEIDVLPWREYLIVEKEGIQICQFKICVKYARFIKSPSFPNQERIEIAYFAHFLPETV
jgi:hypothetical protein